MNFWIRRFFRIAPMYYLGAALYFILEPPAGGFDALQMLRTFGFVNIWSPAWVPTTADRWIVVPGGWSIGVEFTFYLLFPALAAWARSPGRAFALLVPALAIGCVANTANYAQFLPLYGADATGDFVYFSFPNQIYVFVLGAILYFAVERLRRAPGAAPARFLRRHAIALAALCVAAGVVIANLHLPGWFSLHPPWWPTTMAAATLVLMLFVVVLAAHGGAPLVNRPICALGKVSFSAYLLHFAVLHKLPVLLPAVFDRAAEGVPAIFTCFLLWLTAVPLTFAASWVTFTLIEQPMIDQGQRLLRRRAARVSLSAAG